MKKDLKTILDKYQFVIESPPENRAFYQVLDFIPQTITKVDVTVLKIYPHPLLNV